MSASSHRSSSGERKSSVATRLMLGIALIALAAFGLTAAFSLSLWCIAGMLLARLLKTERQWRALNIVLGLVLAASIVPMWRPV